MPGLKKQQLQVQNVQVPHYFRCPISLELMRDPVTVATGQTYDRSSIEKWVEDGNATCPATMQRLHDLTLIPNHTLRRLIQEWCLANTARGIDRIPTPKQPADPRRIQSLLATARHPGLQQLQALRSLRSLARENDKNRVLIADARGAEALVSTLFAAVDGDNGEVLSVGEEEQQQQIQESALAVLVLLPMSPAERCSVTRSCRRLQLLSRLVQRGASLDARTNAAVLIEKLASSSSSTSSQHRQSTDDDEDLTREESSSFSSSGDDEVEEEQEWARMRIGSTPGLLGGLVDLVRCGNSSGGSSSGARAGKAGVKALFAICLITAGACGNCDVAVAAGACGALVEHLPAAVQLRGDAERTLATLELVCRSGAGRAAVARHALAVPALVTALVWRRWFQASECAAGTLLALCSGSEEVQRGAVEAGVLRQLLLLIQSDCTDRAKRKGVELLKLLRRWWADDPCLSDLERTDVVAF